MKLTANFVLILSISMAWLSMGQSVETTVKPPADAEQADVCLWYPMERFPPEMVAIMPSQHVSVKVVVYLCYIQSVDTVAQSVTMTLLLRANWKDERFIDKERATCPPITIENVNKIWHPVVTVLNAARDTNYASLKETGAAVFPTGFVQWPRVITTQISCSFNVRYFPWDKQDCEIVFGIPSYPKAAHINGYSIELVPGDGNLVENLTRFSVFYDKKSDNLPTWQLTKGCYYSKDSDTVPALHYRFRLERKPSYYLLSLGFPTVITSILMAASFVANSGNGEKVTFALTVLLTYLLLLFSVVADVPADSHKIPTVLYFIIVLLCTSCVGTFACTLVRKRAMSKDEQMQKRADAANVASLICYAVVTALEYAIFAGVIATQADVEAKRQQFSGACNYTTGDDITKSISYYAGWLTHFPDQPPPPELQ